MVADEEEDVADWTYATGDVLTNKRWSKLMLAQFMQETWFLRLASKEDTAAILILDDLEKHAGDQITYGISELMTAPGVLDLNTLTGTEEAVLTFGDSLVIHELAHATLLKGPISNQRVLFDRRKTGRNRLADWYAARIDHSAANQAAGLITQTDTRFTGLQATTAVSGTNRHVWAGGVTDAASLTGGTHLFTIDLIDKAQLKAKALTSGIRPIKIGGRSMYVCVMHPTQATDLRTNTNVGQWFDIQKAAMTGGDIGDNPIFWQSLGMYRQALLHENARIPNAIANAGTIVANTKRALFFGAQGMTLAFGRASGQDQKFHWMEEMRDYGRQLGIAVSGVWGLKKVVMNSVDQGIIVIDSEGTDIDTLGDAATNAQ